MTSLASTNEREGDMDRKEVMKMFNRQSRIGALATSNKNGDVNAAVFGSPQMIDEETVIMAIGDNRSFQYLQ
jgi:predicted pyridoxine 5'-phosphate oxidase superfamily flavin-nucleotide-binding protein